MTDYADTLEAIQRAGELAAETVEALADARRKVLAALEGDYTQTELARMAGISRQRVAQLLEER